MSKQAFKEFKNALTKALDNNEAWQKSKASGSADAYIKSDQSSIITDDRYIQHGLDYTPFIDAGRGKGKPPPVSNLYEWLQYKKYGISYATNKERLSIATALSKSIAKNGSWKFKNNKSTTVFEDVIKESRPSLEKALAESQRIRFEAPILEAIQEINNNK